MSDNYLIEKMMDMKARMLFVASKLVDRGNADHGHELAMAAGTVQTWIDGIRADSATERKP